MTPIAISSLLFTLLTLDKFVFPATQLSDKNVISDVQFGSMQTFLETNGYVHHLDEDIFVPGNILYSEDHTLRTTDGKTVYVIVGSVQGYAEGISTQSRFHWLDGFLQINSTHVLVVDSGNHCLRFVNRLTNQTSQFVGGCTSYEGFRDGYYTDARFNRPYSVVNDVNNLQTVIVADFNNKALRSVALNTGQVTTLIRSLPEDPFKAVFNANKEEMLILMRNSLGRFNLKTLVFRTLTASSTQGLDGDFTIASFKDTTSILRISDDFHLVADQGSNKIRIVNMKKRTIASICDGVYASVDGPINVCSLRNPFSLLLKSGTLYIGEYQNIRSIQVKAITPCNNISVKLSDGEQKKCLEVTPGQNACYPLGSHHYKIADKNCSIVITVTKDDKSTMCPSGIYEAADAITMKAKVKLSEGHDMTLSVGEHIYHKQISYNMTCEITVHVSDPRLKKRLDISANYQLSCALLNDLQGVILSVARTRYHQIQLISSGRCNQSADHGLTMACKDNVLSVLWPTDCVFQKNLVVEQENVVTAINEYLKKNKGPILDLVIPNHIPPIIKPILNSEGLPITVSMVSFCSGNLKYFNTTQTCM